MKTTSHNILLSNILSNVSVAYRCLLCSTTIRAHIYLSKCSDAPIFSDKFFNASLKIYLPTRVQNFVEISQHLAMLWQKCIGLVFWNTVNFVGSSVIHVSQGSVWWNVYIVLYSKCPAESVSKRIFFKLVKIWQSYCQKFGGLVVV